MMATPCKAVKLVLNMINNVNIASAGHLNGRVLLMGLRTSLLICILHTSVETIQSGICYTAWKRSRV